MEISSLASGLAVGLGVTLTAASIAKLLSRASFEVTLVRLLPQSAWRNGLTSSRLAVAVGVVELLLGISLIIAPESFLIYPAIAAIGLFSVFALASVVARSKRVSCGCAGSLSEGPTQWVDVFRSAALVIFAAALLVAVGSPPRGSSSSSVLLAFAVATIGTWPILRAFARRTVRSAARQEDGSSAQTRRKFLGAAASLAASGVALLFFGRPPSALAGGGGYSCEARFGFCRVCCPDMSCVDCCIGCYGACKTFLGFGCSSGACSNCWD
jgi:hypothetical protein